MLATAGLLIGLAVVQTIVGFCPSRAADVVNWLVLGALLTVPLAFLYGLLRSRFGATTRRLVAELSEKRTPEEVQGVLRRALRDPTLELGYVGSQGAGYVDVDGRPLQLPGLDADRVVTPIGEAVVVHDASLQDQPELDEVVNAARIALERGLSLRSLEESERRAHAVLDAIPDNVYRLSLDGTFLDVHAKGRGGYPERQIYPGLQPSSLIGRRIDDVMPEISDVVLAGITARARHRRDRDRRVPDRRAERDARPRDAHRPQRRRRGRRDRPRRHREEAAGSRSAPCSSRSRPL